MWPLPAFGVWAGCWLLFAAATALGAGAPAAFVAAALLGAGCAWTAATRWRRVFVGLGFPCSLAASGLAGALPAWSWLLPLVLLVLVYPPHAWRDAPIFSTRRNALRGLARHVALAPDAAILDAGSGLGAALVELRREYPRATITGIEWSWPLWLATTLRCRFARVLRGDLWSADWTPYALVYLFQRPESMARALAKAAHELRSGAWLASLEFEIATLVPERVVEVGRGRRLWLYRAPFNIAAR